MLSPFDELITDEDIDRFSQEEGLIFDAKRRELLKSMDHMDVQACPGSGKTTLIAAKLILLAERWPYKHQGICVLSHTNVAKNEIIDRLKKSQIKEAQGLLSFPHFIGTIQEFATRFLGAPFIRSHGVKISHVDTDLCVELIYVGLSYGTRRYIDTKSTYSNPLYEFDLKLVDSEIDMNVPTFPDGSESNSYKDLVRVRKSLMCKGVFFYRDFYVFGEKLLIDIPSCANSLQKRFPCVLLDEMQDTQKFQDELLTKIFPLDGEVTTVQRFGDADQAIFHGINNEEPNESYNGKAPEELEVINKSHRFDNSIAELIKGTSFNRVSLDSELSAEALEERKDVHASNGNFEHTIFLFDEGNANQVIEAFADHVSSQFTEAYKQSEKFTVKVVGAVGNEINDDKQLKIGHYWEHFKKDKSKSSFKERTLYEAVIYCCNSTDVNWSRRYKILNRCLLRIIRMACKKDAEDNYYNSTSMKEYLKENEKWKELRKLMFHLINSGEKITEEIWGGVTKFILETFEITGSSEELMSYLQFGCDDSDRPSGEVVDPSGSVKPFLGNTLIHSDGFKIELSTIHGVKGETHDATLVLETKNYKFDMEVMLPYLTGDLPDQNNPNSSMSDNPNSRKANKKFMRQLYVAMSRPKHLLCLAMRKSALGDGETFHANKTKLESMGWRTEEIERL